MTPEAVLRALLDIWDEQPALVGADWSKILPDLEALISRFGPTSSRQ